MPTLHHTLDTRLKTLWPINKDQELLLDLGERKRWSEEDRQTQLARLSTWLHQELGLPEQLQQLPPEPWPSPDLKTFGKSLGLPPLPGVGAWLCGLAAATGASSKTLSNTLTGGYTPWRPSHRWLRAIGRCLGEQPPVEAWLYHERTAARVTEALAAPGIHAGHALLLHSLVTLWQRRRPTQEVRANRHKRAPRRDTPKPAPRQALISAGQLRPLRAVAEAMGDRGRALLLLALESALTQAHLAPHPARRHREPPEPETGEGLLSRVEEALSSELLSATEVQLFRVRLDRMRAYRDARAPADPPEAVAEHPYVRATLDLAANHRGQPPQRAYTAQSPGLLMLLPQLRSRGYTLL